MAHGRYKKVEITGAWTLNKRIQIPERKITKPSRTYTYVPMRGYAYGLAVLDKHGRYIGWMSVPDTLGYANVTEWIKATGWVDQGH